MAKSINEVFSNFDLQMSRKGWTSFRQICSSLLKEYDRRSEKPIEPEFWGQKSRSNFSKK